MSHVALLGPPKLLDRCAPAGVEGLTVSRIDRTPTSEAIASVRPDAVVAFEPTAQDLAALDEAELPTLLWWLDAPPRWAVGSGSSGPRQTVTGRAGAAPGVWRSVAPPVADELFADPDALFDGGDPDRSIAVNFDEDRPASTHDALIALARGELLVSKPLTPSRGLEPGIDYVEAHDLDEARAAVENAIRAPDAFRRMRLRGRRKAELFRSSRVLTRLVGDLLLERDLVSTGR